MMDDYIVLCIKMYPAIILHMMYFCALIMNKTNHFYTLFVFMGISGSFLCANGRPVLGSDPRQNPKHGVKQIIQMETQLFQVFENTNQV